MARRLDVLPSGAVAVQWFTTLHGLGMVTWRLVVVVVSRALNRGRATADGGTAAVAKGEFTAEDATAHPVIIVGGVDIIVIIALRTPPRRLPSFPKILT